MSFRESSKTCKTGTYCLYIGRTSIKTCMKMNPKLRNRCLSGESEMGTGRSKRRASVLVATFIFYEILSKYCGMMRMDKAGRLGFIILLCHGIWRIGMPAP